MTKTLCEEEFTICEIVQENENLKKWLKLIKDIGFDYDGYNDVGSLKSLIDELVSYSKYALKDKNYDEWMSDKDE